MVYSVDSMRGRIVDVLNRRIFNGRIDIDEGIVVGVREEAGFFDDYILPGFIDSHVHIESSLLVPYEFARLALPHGTVGAVCDPHEIANVLGVPGIDYMIESARASGMKCCFGASSCVPATPFEQSGATLDGAVVSELLQRDDIYFLGEMMNYPGVLSRDPAVMGKIACARRLGKPVDGHAPELRGHSAAAYVGAGIGTDHECLTFEEAREKALCGMNILIREGSAARNFNDLHRILALFPRQTMFCCDDLHPDELLLRHIDELVRRSVARGYDLFDVLAAASVNPVKHYRLPVGLLQVGDPADMIVVADLTTFKNRRTIVNGVCHAEEGRCLLPPRRHEMPNYFKAVAKTPEDFRVSAEGSYIRVIEARDGQVVTGGLRERATVVNGALVSDPDRDILKLALVNRYADRAPVVAFVKNFGIREGGMASSIAHDSHNIIALGTNDDYLCRAVNLVVEQGGGLSLATPGGDRVLALPVAGLMSGSDGEGVAHTYAQLEEEARRMGSTLFAPFMTLSFMALLVIPQLKLGDRGLFDSEQFQFVSLSCSAPMPLQGANED